MSHNPCVYIYTSYMIINDGCNSALFQDTNNNLHQNRLDAEPCELVRYSKMCMLWGQAKLLGGRAAADAKPISYLTLVLALKTLLV